MILPHVIQSGQKQTLGSVSSCLGGILQYLEAWQALQKQRLENSENHTNLFSLQLPVQNIISNRHSTQKVTSTTCAKENET